MTTAQSQHKQAGTFALGGIAVVPSISEIGGVRVEAKAMDVLVELAVASPSVTSVRGLLDAVWRSVVVLRHRHALPAVLASFANLWRALRLGPQAPADELPTHAQPRNPGSAIAAGVLRQRPGANEFMLALLCSGDPPMSDVRPGFLP